MTNADRTAELVAHYVRAGLAKRPRRIPRGQYPRLLEAEYATALVQLVNEWRAAAQEMLSELPGILDEARRDEAAPQQARFDSPTRTRTTKTRESVRSTVERVPLVAARSAKRIVDHQQKQFQKQTEAALGVKLTTHDQGLDRRIQHFITENVSRMQAYGDAVVNEVEGILARAYTSGQSADEVAEEILKRFDIAENKARFLARDQVGRLYSQVSRMRSKETGVQAFMWWTQGDGHVRSSHATKHKRIFPYEGSRAPSFFPGDDPGCRCWEEAVFEELKEKVRKLLGKGRKRAA